MSTKINTNPSSSASKAFFARQDAIINPRKLTIEQLKSYKGLENISDDTAKEITDGLYKASILTYNTFMNHPERFKF